MTQILVPICLYCLKWRKFDKLFLREVITIDATRCLDFSSKCTKMRLLLRGGEGREGGEGERRRGEGRGRGGEGRGGPCLPTFKNVPPPLPFIM